MSSPTCLTHRAIVPAVFFVVQGFDHAAGDVAGDFQQDQHRRHPPDVHVPRFGRRAVDRQRFPCGMWELFFVHH